MVRTFLPFLLLGLLGYIGWRWLSPKWRRIEGSELVAATLMLSAAIIILLILWSLR